jgi:ABC-type transporter Mla subunit MlaD
MKENKINAITAIVFCAAAVIMLGALSFAIGKWSWGNDGYEITVRFPNATGINTNSEVKCAGAHAGHVVSVSFIPRSQRDKDPGTGLVNAIVVVCSINKDIEVGKDVGVTIKQDGFGIAAKYVLLTPGSNADSPLLANGDVVQGEMPFDLSDLIQPAGEALTQAKVLVNQLGPLLTQAGPMLTRLDKLSESLQTTLPPLIGHADKFLQDGDSLVANFNTPQSRQQLNEIVTSLRVSTENLKVVSTNAKALTATLAEKPWRVFWGGPTVKPPPESEVLKSNKVIPLKQDVDVNSPDSTPSKTH